MPILVPVDYIPESYLDRSPSKYPDRYEDTYSVRLSIPCKLLDEVAASISTLPARDAANLLWNSLEYEWHGRLDMNNIGRYIAGGAGCGNYDISVITSDYERAIEHGKKMLSFDERFQAVKFFWANRRTGQTSDPNYQHYDFVSGSRYIKIEGDAASIGCWMPNEIYNEWEAMRGASFDTIQAHEQGVYNQLYSAYVKRYTANDEVRKKRVRRALASLPVEE